MAACVIETVSGASAPVRVRSINGATSFEFSEAMSGAIGRLIAVFLKTFIGDLGTWLVLLIALIATVVFMIDLDIQKTLARIQALFQRKMAGAASNVKKRSGSPKPRSHEDFGTPQSQPYGVRAEPDAIADTEQASFPKEVQIKTPSESSMPYVEFIDKEDPQPAPPSAEKEPEKTEIAPVEEPPIENQNFEDDLDDIQITVHPG